MQKNHLLMGLLLSVLTLQTAWAESFNHNTWNNLLMAHVSPVNGGAATVVDYQGMARDREQLDKQSNLFLSDRSRNRVEADVIKISSIFKWYQEDFEKGWLGYRRLENFLIAHSDALQISDAMTAKLKSDDADIEFLDYDWRLNQKR